VRKPRSLETRKQSPVADALPVAAPSPLSNAESKGLAVAV